MDGAGAVPCTGCGAVGVWRSVQQGYAACAAVVTGATVAGIGVVTLLLAARLLAMMSGMAAVGHAVDVRHRLRCRWRRLQGFCCDWAERREANQYCQQQGNPPGVESLHLIYHMAVRRRVNMVYLR